MSKKINVLTTNYSSSHSDGVNDDDSDASSDETIIIVHHEQQHRPPSRQNTVPLSTLNQRQRHKQSKQTKQQHHCRSGIKSSQQQQQHNHLDTDDLFSMQPLPQFTTANNNTAATTISPMQHYQDPQQLSLQPFSDQSLAHTERHAEQNNTIHTPPASSSPLPRISPTAPYMGRNNARHPLVQHSESSYLTGSARNGLIAATPDSVHFRELATDGIMVQDNDDDDGDDHISISPQNRNNKKKKKNQNKRSSNPYHEFDHPEDAILVDGGVDLQGRPITYYMNDLRHMAPVKGGRQGATPAFTEAELQQPNLRLIRLQGYDPNAPQRAPRDDIENPPPNLYREMTPAELATAIHERAQYQQRLMDYDKIHHHADGVLLHGAGFQSFFPYNIESKWTDADDRQAFLEHQSEIVKQQQQQLGTTNRGEHAQTMSEIMKPALGEQSYKPDRESNNTLSNTGIHHVSTTGILQGRSSSSSSDFHGETMQLPNESQYPNWHADDGVHGPQPLFASSISGMSHSEHTAPHRVTTRDSTSTTDPNRFAHLFMRDPRQNDDDGQINSGGVPPGAVMKPQQGDRQQSHRTTTSDEEGIFRVDSLPIMTHGTISGNTRHAPDSPSANTWAYNTSSSKTTQQRDSEPAQIMPIHDPYISSDASASSANAIAQMRPMNGSAAGQTYRGNMIPGDRIDQPTMISTNYADPSISNQMMMTVNSSVLQQRALPAQGSNPQSIHSLIRPSNHDDPATLYGESSSITHMTATMNNHSRSIQQRDAEDPTAISSLFSIRAQKPDWNTHAAPGGFSSTLHNWSNHQQQTGITDDSTQTNRVHCSSSGGIMQRGSNPTNPHHLITNDDTDSASHRQYSRLLNSNLDDGKPIGETFRNTQPTDPDGLLRLSNSSTRVNGDDNDFLSSPCMHSDLFDHPPINHRTSMANISHQQQQQRILSSFSTTNDMFQNLEGSGNMSGHWQQQQHGRMTTQMPTDRAPTHRDLAPLNVATGIFNHDISSQMELSSALMSQSSIPPPPTMRTHRNNDATAAQNLQLVPSSGTDVSGDGYTRPLATFIHDPDMHYAQFRDQIQTDPTMRPKTDPETAISMSAGTSHHPLIEMPGQSSSSTRGNTVTTSLMGESYVPSNSDDTGLSQYVYTNNTSFENLSNKANLAPTQRNTHLSEPFSFQQHKQQQNGHEISSTSSSFSAIGSTDQTEGPNASSAHVLYIQFPGDRSGQQTSQRGNMVPHHQTASAAIHDFNSGASTTVFHGTYTREPTLRSQQQQIDPNTLSQTVMSGPTYSQQTASSSQWTQPGANISPIARMTVSSHPHHHVNSMQHRGSSDPTQWFAQNATHDPSMINDVPNGTASSSTLLGHKPMISQLQDGHTGQTHQGHHAISMYDIARPANLPVRYHPQPAAGMISHISDFGIATMAVPENQQLFQRTPSHRSIAHDFLHNPTHRVIQQTAPQHESIDHQPPHLIPVNLQPHSEKSWSNPRNHRGQSMQTIERRGMDDPTISSVSTPSATTLSTQYLQSPSSSSPFVQQSTRQTHAHSLLSTDHSSTNLTRHITQVPDNDVISSLHSISIQSPQGISSISSRKKNHIQTDPLQTHKSFHREHMPNYL